MIDPQEEEEIVELFYNQPIIDFLEQREVKVKAMKGSRGGGKTRAIGEDVYDRVVGLPRSRQFLSSLTFEAIDSNIMPDVHDVLRLHGLVDGIHYVEDQEPPPHFVLPYKKLINPARSISFFNGTCFQKISMGKSPKKNRGRSFDGGIIDEALNLDGWAVRNILLPTLRGINRWIGTPGEKMHKMLSIYSSPARTPEGKWFMLYKKLAAVNPTDYYWGEVTAFDNLAVLGENYIEDQRAQLGYHDFHIEIMNEDNVKDKPTLFYYQHDETRHHYVAEKLEDVDGQLGLEMSFDFGGRYSCCTVSQEQGMVEKIVHEFDTNNLTEDERNAGKAKKVPDLVRDFCKVFRNHPTKRIDLWGDRTGLNPNELDESTLFDKIKGILEENGWEVRVRVTYADSALHKSRYSFLNDVFEESGAKDYPRLRINALTCPNLIVSLDTTRVTDEFKKDKKDERNAHFNQSYAPHLTDTLDYKMFNKYRFLLDDDYASSGYSGMDGGIDTF